MKEILEHESWSTNPEGVCIMKEILEHESWGSMYHEGTLGAQISYEYVFFGFFSKKDLEHGVCIMNRKSSKTQRKLSFAPFPRISRLHVFLGKNGERGKKNNLVWSTNVPGERISLENESLETPIGKIVVRKILVRKPRQKTAASKPQQFVPSHE